MRALRILVPLLSVCWLGCQSAPEESIDPFAPVPLAWAGGEGSAEFAEESTDALEVWWDHFDDPDLAPLIEEALRAHPDLFAAAARVRAATSALESAGALSWPELTGSLTAGRQRQNFIGIDIPGTGDVLSSTSTSLGASIAARWEVDLWGRLSAVERGAAAAAEATIFDALALRLSLSARVASAWFLLIEAERQVELAEEIRNRWSESEERITARVREGLAGTLDLRLARSERAGADADLVGAKRRRGSARRALELLLGRYPAEALAARATLPSLDRPIPVALPATVLARRPDLQAARARLAGAAADRERAEADLWPQLVLTASGGRLSEELSDLLDGDFSVWSLAAGLVGPLFDHGRRRAEVDAATARRTEAEARFAGAVLAACGEVEGALRDEAWLVEEEARVAEFRTETERAREVARDQYARGLVDILALLGAERNAASAEGRVLAIERARLENRLRLLVALGGAMPTTDVDFIDPDRFDADSNKAGPVDSMREERAP